MLKENKKLEVTLRDLLRVIFRHKLIIVVSFVTVMITVYLGLDLRVPVYRSQVRMLVAGTMQRDVEVARSLGPGSLVLTQMALVNSRPIIERTVKALKLHQRPLDYKRKRASRLKKILIDNEIKAFETSLAGMTPEQKQSTLINKAVGELIGSISTFPEMETSIFNIIVTDYDPNVAGKIANVLSRSFVIFDLEQQIAELQLTYGNRNETIRKLENHIEDLQETLDGRILPDIEAIGPATVKIITQAGYGQKVRLKPTRASALIAAFIISMVIGVVIAFVLDFFDQTFRAPDDIEKFLNISSLGSLPKRKAQDRHLVKSTNSVSKHSQLLQNLSNRIYMSMKDQNLKTLLLSDAEGSGETALIAADLSICLSSKLGYKVLIIDADLRSPSLHKYFEVADAPGLSDVVQAKIDFGNAVIDLGSNLNILQAGDKTVNPVAILESSVMSDVVREVKGLYDLIIIACPDVTHYSDTIILSSITDSVVFVINEGMVRRQVVQNAVAPFILKDIKIMGAVLNNHKYNIPEIIYRLT